MVESVVVGGRIVIVQPEEERLLDPAVEPLQRGGSHLAGRSLDDGRVRIEVEDDGPGVAAEHRDRLFERFFRVDPGRSREMGGTGLGLAIVKHIVNRHRGRLRIESAPGQGACFSVVLPVS